jgi:hypothetical protein
MQWGTSGLLLLDEILNREWGVDRQQPGPGRRELSTPTIFIIVLKRGKNPMKISNKFD